jgi:hypothetical protein
LGVGAGVGFGVGSGVGRGVGFLKRRQTEEEEEEEEERRKSKDGCKNVASRNDQHLHLFVQIYTYGVGRGVG